MASCGATAHLCLPEVRCGHVPRVTCPYRGGGSVEELVGNLHESVQPWGTVSLSTSRRAGTAWLAVPCVLLMTARGSESLRNVFTLPGLLFSLFHLTELGGKPRGTTVTPSCRRRDWGTGEPTDTVPLTGVGRLQEPGPLRWCRPVPGPGGDHSGGKIQVTNVSSFSDGKGDLPRVQTQWPPDSPTHCSACRLFHSYTWAGFQPHI